MKINDMISTAQAAPYFASDLERMINVTYQCTKIYQLPQIKDTNPVGQVKINFVSSTTRVGLPNFIVYQQNKLIIKPTQTIEIAIHTITIILTNQNKQTQNYTLYVQVLPYDSQVMQSITIDTSKRKDFMIQSKRENFPKAKMVKVNQRGEVTVKLDRRGSSKDLQIKEDNFLFQVDPPQRLQWKIKQDRQTESLMIIQLEFENSQSISISAMKRSKLQMFFKPSIGIRRLESILCGRSLQTQQSDPLLFYQDDVDIPVQLESDKIMTFFNNLGKTFKSIATSILASNLSVTMIMSCSMQLLWSFINSMQLISLIPLMTLNIPSNMYYLCSLISGPLAFQLIDVSNITKSLFSLQQYYEPYNQQFGQFGFQNTMLIVELQASLYILLLTPGIFALIFCLKKCQHKHLRIRKIAQKLKSWMRYSFYIRLLVEEFLLVFIVSVINVTVGGFSSWGEIFSFSFSIFMICLTLSLPFIIAFYIQRNKLTDHGRKNIGKRLGSIYLDVRKDTVGRLLYSAIYIVRRLIFCLSVIFIDTNPMLQILLFHLMSIVQFVYIGLWKPFENPLQNKIELMNESFVLIISILMPGFTDYLDDETGFTQEMLGWVVLGLLGLNCAINIVVQVKDQFQKIRVLYFRLKGCRLFTKWTRVKMMSDTQQIEGDLQQAKRGTRKFSEDTVFSTKTGLKELKMIPIDHVPTHEQQFAKGINIESLQLFTPRGRNLLDRNTPLDVISDVKILEIAEEEKEEDDNNNQIRYELGQKLERAATASQYPPRQRQNRDAHLKQLDEVSNIHNFDDFFTQFSMSPYENTKMKNKLASTMIRIRPTLDTINNQDSETLDPQLLAGYLKTENKQEKDKIYQTMHDSQMHLTTLNNNASTYLSTVPHQNALQQLMSHQSPYRDYLVGVPAEQAVDRLYEILNSRLGSSSEGSSSQSSGDSQKDSGNRFRNQSPLPEKRTKKKPPSRIKQYDDNK